MLIALAACGDADEPVAPDPEPIVDFAVVSMTTHIQGSGDDANGFLLTFNGKNKLTTSGETVVDTVPPGTYQARVSDLAPQCWSLNEDVQSVTVTKNARVVIDFNIECVGGFAYVYNEMDGFGQLATEVRHLTATGETVVRYSEGPVKSIAISPDQSKFALGISNDLVVFGDGWSRKIGPTGGWVTNPLWSPDSRTLSYSFLGEDRKGWDDMRVYTFTPDSPTPATIPNGDVFAAAMGQWSKDGTTMTFIHPARVPRSGTQWRVYEGDVDSSTATDLGLIASFGFISTSYDGNLIAFVTPRPEGGSWAEMSVYNRSSKETTVLGPMRSGRARQVWSPTENRLFWRTASNIHLVWDHDKQQAFEIRDGNRLSWSPDGRWILYSKAVNGQHDLWLYRADGSEARPLVESIAGQELSPHWGERVAN